MADGAASGGIVFQHLRQRRDAAVVHVRCGQRDVAQRRRLELAGIGGALRLRVYSKVRNWIRELPGQIIQTRVMELDRNVPATHKIDGVAEVETAMAAKTRGPAVVQEEQDFAPLGGLGNCVRLAFPMESIVWRSCRDDGAFERSQS